jgi:hypothetical protein
LVKDENGDLLADSHATLNRQKNCQVLNVHWVNNVGQREIHTAEALVPELSYFEGEITTELLERYKSPGSDQIPPEMVQARGNTLHSNIHKLISSI